MRPERRRSTVALLIIWTLAYGVLLLETPLLLRTPATLYLTGLLPGILLVDWALGRSASPPTALEWPVYSMAAGFSLLAVVMLLLSYLPGELHPWQTHLAFGLLTLVLAAPAWGGRRAAPPPQDDLPDRRLNRRAALWAAAGVALLLATAIPFRFINAGYAEFHGDEARAVTRAAAVIQGYDDVLFLHRKGPGEILVPTAIFSLAGRVNEANARLPFALANLTALVGVFLLGWRMAGPLAGWAAAFLLAFDGYLIAFSRFVQYQSVVLLLSVAAVLMAYRLYRTPRALTPYALLIALFLASGLLYHYDAALAILPVMVLLVAAWVQRRIPARALGAAFAGALLLALAVLGLFYLPFFWQPGSQVALLYVVEGRLGAATPESDLRNNIVDIFTRTSVYSSSYYVALLVFLAAVTLTGDWWRAFGERWRWVAAALAVVSIGITFWNLEVLEFESIGLTFIPFLIAIGTLWVAPSLPIEQRTLWLWFGAPFLGSLFLISSPRTHVHVIMVPWALLAGVAVARIGALLERYAGRRPALAVGVAAAVAAALIFGYYIERVFLNTEAESVLYWETAQPAGYWSPAGAATIDALYGLPLNNGWKAPGALYEQGAIAGDFDALLWADYIPAWYTRGQVRCGATATWYFTVRGLEPWAEAPEAAEDRIEAQGFTPWSQVLVRGVPRMTIYAQPGVEAAPAATLNVEEFESAFDAAADPYFPLTYPVVEPPIAHPLTVNFGDKITLEGYTLEQPPTLHPGDSIVLTLHWRGQQRMAEGYKVTVQAYDESGAKALQSDRIPVCDRRDTWRWWPGESAVDRHVIPILDEAAAGSYPLYVALYNQETGERLPVLDAAGNVIDDKMLLETVQIASR